MPLKLDFQLLGVSESKKAAIRDSVSASGLDRRPGRWRVQLIGKDRDAEWELRISGPGVERSEYLDSSTVKRNPAHVAETVRNLLG